MNNTRIPARGAGALVVTIMLLLGTSIAVFYLNRGLIFEQKTSANQARATVAREVAEAGVQWAIGMLNSDAKGVINTSCAFVTSGATATFRQKYAQTALGTGSTNIVPATNVFPGCKISGTSLSCSCPDQPSSGSTATASLGSTELPGFTVAFSTTGDNTSLRVTSTGCTGQAAACVPGSGSADSTATVSVIVKLARVLDKMPKSTLTCGTVCNIGGSFNIYNQDVAANGILVNAGGAITTAPGTSMYSIPGIPSQNAMIGSDGSLASVSSSDPTCNNSAMFQTYFGSTLSQFKNAPTTTVISCSGPSDCEGKLMAAYNNQNARSFYFDSDLQLSGNNTLGSVAQPVMIATPNAIKINGTWDIYGLIFSNDSDWNDLGTGSATIHGAQISCAGYKSNGNGTLTYDADVLKNLQQNTAVMAPVPGSWRDATAY